MLPSDTVTAQIEALAGEPVVARVLSRVEIEVPCPEELRVAPGQLVTRRRAVLCGARSGLPLLYAETILVTDRLPPSVHRQLEGGEPIGRLLAPVLDRVTREWLTADRAGAGSLAADGNGRRYRLELDRTPIMVIEERVLPGLSRQAAPPVAPRR